MCDNWNIFTFDGPKKYVTVEFGRKYINVYYFSKLVGVEYCVWYFCRIFHYWYLEHYWIFRNFSISGYWNNSWRRNANMVVGETSWCPPYISFKPFHIQTIFTISYFICFICLLYLNLLIKKLIIQVLEDRIFPSTNNWLISFYLSNFIKTTSRGLLVVDIYKLLSIQFLMNVRRSPGRYYTL